MPAALAGARLGGCEDSIHEPVAQRARNNVESCVVLVAGLSPKPAGGNNLG